ncbi:hypothetical protein GLYMA_16G167700v4 [Glycine max]|uniref:Myb/SANT-like DNA-binding domain-containing protein n=1 Tax=Glycine max TaxID=3847 RepID=I1MP74_SOYBN|nr:uncharacterized protein LOC100805861 [Glycine max]KRH08700.1 hypothetical protein GLYMA_16G167700v4 [Glycine max]|eukprot:XP_003548116.1 uncharacterized protein LOC100805861 [Glycine max]
MEGKLSKRGMLQGRGRFGGSDLPRSMRVRRKEKHPHSMNQQHIHHCQRSLVHSSIHDGLPLTMGSFQKCDHQILSMTEFNQRGIHKTSPSDASLVEECVDGHHEAGKGKKSTPWQQVKWTDKMVKLLIMVMSYIGEDATFDNSSKRRKFTVLQNKGKWKSISKVMAERGYHVSPQQCEDKFNDLSKSYKKLNVMLGRGTSCRVVENPSLLDLIDYLSEKEKDHVRKILSSKHLFYEEMCSYHNGNRLHLPHDPTLQQSLQAALQNRDDHDSDDIRRSHHYDYDKDDIDMESSDQDDFEENYASLANSRGVYGATRQPLKRLKTGQGQVDVATFGSALNSREYNKSSYSPVVQSDGNQDFLPKMRAAWLQKQSVESRSLQLEEQKLQIQDEMLELKKQRFKWQKFSRKKDLELEKLKLENERMKIENERIALKLKRQEISANFN